MMRAAAVLLVVSTLLACNTQKTLWGLGLGSFTTDLTVSGVATRSEWLDALVEGHGLSLRTFVLANDVCRRVFEPGAPIDYVERGIGGRFVRGDDSCDAVGFGSPMIDRARRGRPGSLRTAPIPREQATFRVIFEDEEVILARGRFPLARALGWTGSGDSIAVFPNTELCRVPLERGVASMEFRASGRYTLTLVSSGGQCPFEGLIQPAGQAPAPEPSEQSDRTADGLLAQR
jgi:hypothetical protein